MRREFVSFPKSGRSWVRYALVCLDLAKDITFHHDGFEFNDGTHPPLDFDFESRTSRYKAEDGRFVYLERDPRDVMVSLYSQITGRFKDIFNYAGTMSEFIRDPYFGAHNLIEFQRQWSQVCTNGNALKITYEDCHKDLPSTIRSVIDYFGFVADSEDLQRACDMAHFDNMKVVEASGEFQEPWLQPRNGALKVRRGIVGGYRESLSLEDQIFLDKVFGY